MGQDDYPARSSDKETISQQWNDWTWQLKNRITSFDQIEKLLPLTPQETLGIKSVKKRMPMGITPYFFSLINQKNPNCPIRKQIIPRIEELDVSPHDLVDPCGEDAHSPVPGLVHRYPDRVLLMVTDTCATYCRYCTRGRLVGKKEDILSEKGLEDAYKYIAANKKIRDVLISGGDPLMLSDEKIESILKNITAIPHVEMVRMGTRAPVTLPMRITDELVQMLRKYHPLWLSIHFTHPKEITDDVRKACTKLADAGIPLGSQTVLLKGINDSTYIMKKLLHELIKIRVRPYYVYQCDLAVGTEHFRTPVSAGISIAEKLRGHTTGYAVPTFVVDAPGGGGKIPVFPDYVVAYRKGKMVLRNFQNKQFSYFDPGTEKDAGVPAPKDAKILV
ncbi:MAG TPA: lysine 2,3-aminomutase [bacterium]|nr:lysine 2,3-aminomutase [bacterium]